jgi:hypothetical protein
VAETVMAEDHIQEKEVETMMAEDRIQEKEVETMTVETHILEEIVAEVLATVRTKTKVARTQVQNNRF